MSMKKLFPIGSVVSLEGVATRVMIIGHMQSQADNHQIWDYAAVPYPIGIIDPDKFILFNHDKINVLFFLGLQDKEGLEYMKTLYYHINDIELPEEK